MTDGRRHLSSWLKSVVLAAVIYIPLTAVSLGDSHPQVTLAHGSINKFQWSVGVEREPSGNPRRPCISTATNHGGIMVCGSLQPVPLLLADSSGAGTKKRTVLAMGFPRRVAAVRLWLRRRASRIVKLRLLSRKQAQDVGLRRFSYAARAFSGAYCLQRFATYDRKADLLELSPKMGCSE
jgi:hypothetical protein